MCDQCQIGEEKVKRLAAAHRQKAQQGSFGHFQLMDDSFTENNDWNSKRNPTGEKDMLMYHSVFAFSAGIPLCCMMYWIQSVHVRSKNNIAMELRTGNNPATLQCFALCPRARHDWPEWVMGLATWVSKEDNGEEHDVSSCGCGVCTNWNAYASWFIDELGLGKKAE